MTDIALDFDDRAYHEFLRAAKLYWSREMYAALHEDFTRRGLANANVDDAERAMRDTPGYQFFGWFERNLQKDKYASPHGILAAVDKHRARIERDLRAAAAEGAADGRLRLDPAFAQPNYYAKTAFHQHPGGVWRDAVAGVAYEIGRQTTTPLNADPYGMHDRFADAVPRGDYRAILDLGCGTGRSTFPFAARYPNAALYGIDLSAPCLTLAYINAKAKGVDVRWSQQPAERTDFADGTFDLIHSTFLLHELPVKAIAAIVDEAVRLLRPGGVFVHVDFHAPPGGTWGRFIHYGHARRNNEVFMRSFCELDFVALERAAGLVDAAMTPFDDGTGVVPPDQAPPAWRFPFQLFIARKPGV
ncbi:MAG: class I SAM-dependent methyltransferase [Rhodospirillaceae bacterium]|nr:class I SAM-dependent methyltransferase [Rhodospirillaceae bacterium]